MTVQTEHDHTPLDTLAHEIQNCLHVVGVGLELLEGARGDDAQFAELLVAMTKSNKQAVQLLSDYVRTVHEAAA